VGGGENLRSTRRQESHERIAAFLEPPQKPSNEAASAPAERLATGFTAKDKKLPGSPQDPSVAVVAAVGEEGEGAPIC
jgi:hypothetical protein